MPGPDLLRGLPLLRDERFALPHDTVGTTDELEPLQSLYRLGGVAGE